MRPQERFATLVLAFIAFPLGAQDSTRHVTMPAVRLAASPAPIAWDSDSWFSSDKVQHFFSSFFVQSVSYSGLRALRVGHEPALVTASATTIVVGVGKEIHDATHHGDASYKDLAWDLAGLLSATILLNHTRR